MDLTALSLGRWDRRFLGLAQHIASWSKDPSTKAGAVIVGEGREVLSMGYNGFPRGMADHLHRYDDREFKLRHVVMPRKTPCSTRRETEPVSRIPHCSAHIPLASNVWLL